MTVMTVQLANARVRRPVDAAAIFGRDRPLYVPGYFDADITLDAHPNNRSRHWGSLPNWEAALTLLPGSPAPSDCQWFVNCHQRDSTWGRNRYPFHKDDCGGKIVRSVFALGGHGWLSFLRGSREQPGDGVLAWAIPPDGELLTFPLDPGDAIFWTQTVEDAGWEHGGCTGERTSFVCRFPLPAPPVGRSASAVPGSGSPPRPAGPLTTGLLTIPNVSTLANGETVTLTANTIEGLL